MAASNACGTDREYLEHLKQLTLRSLFRRDPELKRKLENDHPKLAETISELLRDNENRFMIAGGFAAFLLGKTTEYCDVDIFYFGRELHLSEDQWWYGGIYYSGFKPKCDVKVYTHRDTLFELVWVCVGASYLESFFVILDSFDSHLVKKGISLFDYSVLDIDWGKCDFAHGLRGYKYFVDRKCERVFNPEPLRLKCLKKIFPYLDVSGPGKSA